MAYLRACPLLLPLRRLAPPPPLAPPAGAPHRAGASLGLKACHSSPALLDLAADAGRARLPQLRFLWREFHDGSARAAHQHSSHCRRLLQRVLQGCRLLYLDLVPIQPV